MPLPVLLDALAVFVFALTGALAASRAQLDVIGFVFLAGLTAVGGGTLRDLILDRTVFWVATPVHLSIVAAAAVLVFGLAPFLESRARWLDWLDAAALSVAVPAGFTATLAFGHGAAVVLVLSVMTGTFGGILRDVVANEVPMILRKGELYASAAFAGAGAGLIAFELGLAPPVPTLVVAGVTFALRAGSLIFGWHLPVYRHGPPQTRPKRFDD
ncbi:MAG: trimeric intracellular cation channel family protein [Pseudomonadota bacterium]